MIVDKIDNMVNGWFIGDFEPSILKTNEFEIGIRMHKQGEKCPDHYHAYATEFNVLLFGTMRINDTDLGPGDIFTFLPNEISRAEFYEDCTIVVVKVPSNPTDKVVV
jgi:quercetin dioxygenase-like cupin family protein